VRVLIGTINRSLSDEFANAVDESFGSVYIEFLGSVKEDVAVLLFAPAEQYDEVFSMTKDLGFSRVNLSFTGVPSAMVDANLKRIADLEKERAAALAAIAEMGAEHENLLIVRDNLKTVLAREKASENFLATDSVVMMDGWVPEAELGSFETILKRCCGENYFTELEDVEIDCTEVPIKLKNNPLVKAFESVTAMYSMPRYNEFDPTPIMMPFYWLFFGLMVGDIGYGVLLVVTTALVLKLVDLKDGMRNFLQFFHFLSYGVILGGVLYGGAFGITVFTPVMGPEGPKAILDSQKDITTMLILSVILGVIHIFVGLITKAVIHIKYGRWFDAFCDGFIWIITLLSAFGWLLGSIGILNPSIGKVGNWIFWVSIVGLALTQGRSSPSLGGKIGNGLYGTYGLANYIGDFVSYTRITALALSGAYIGYAFNTMIGILPPVVNIIGGALIALVGHALNLGLAMLGAYVHTCRLQYVEFFGKFYEGGGVPYAPLKCSSDYVHINK
jgi:V/A-type H+-transporting ATPase subunit I